jgi:hypothetical protein
MIVDVKAAAEKVEEYRHIWMQADAIHDRNEDYFNDPGFKSTLSVLDSKLGLIEQIAEAIDPRIAARLRETSSLTWSHGNQLATLDELLGRLHGKEDEERILGVAGPNLSASQLHHWVWDHAAALWDDGHRREAVQAAATAIFDSHLPAKLGSSAGKPRDLVSQALSLEPPLPGKPRLRLPSYDEGTPTWKDAHEGAMYLGFACIQAVRNVATHTVTQPDEAVALEALATLSLFARWVDAATLTQAS